MNVHSSLIDHILEGNSGLEGTDLSEAEKLGEEFTALTEGAADETPMRRRAVYNHGGRRTNLDHDPLAEVASSMQIAASKVPNSFKEIAKAAAQVAPRIKTNSIKTAVLAAAARLNRILAKTPEQMVLDGAKTAKDYANPDMVPGWAKQVRADLTLVRQAVARYGVSAAKRASTEHIPSITDAQVTHWVDSLLKAGIPHSKILDKIANASALTVSDKQLGTDYLNSHDPAMKANSMNVIGPDAFNQSSPDKYERTTPKLGMKTTAVKAALNALDNHVGERTSLNVKVIANRPAPPTLSKTAAAKAPLRGSSHLAAATRKVATFTVDEVSGYHNAGQSIMKIAKFGIAKVGAAQARQTVEAFLNGLKASKAKIALTQIDCTALRNKLASSNPIVGAPKCGSCSYRTGMHCGLTGGTLLSFPGMERQGSSHKVAAGAKSGTAILSDYELLAPTAAADIVITAPHYASVEAGRAGINL